MTGRNRETQRMFAKTMSTGLNTDDLILALSADAAPRGPSLLSGLLAAVGVGLMAAIVAMHMSLGVRGDVLQSLATSPRFAFKFLATGVVAASMLAVSLRLARPGTRLGALGIALVALPVVILAAGVGLELFALPPAAWTASLMGDNWRLCLTAGPLLSLVPLAVLLMALRRGAPAHPVGAGLVAGLAAGGIGTFAYAAHCPDDSPLFVAAWYVLVMLMVGALGALMGARILRW